MPYVWMDDVPRVQTVGENGIGVSPPIPVEELDKVTGNVKGVVKAAPANSIPNPGSVNSGDAIVEDSGVWGSGEAGGGGSGGGLLVTISATDDEALVMDKTYDEIETALLAGGNVSFLGQYGDMYFVCFLAAFGFSELSGYYGIVVNDSEGTITFAATTKNDYPSTADNTQSGVPIKARLS